MNGVGALNGLAAAVTIVRLNTALAAELLLAQLREFSEITAQRIDATTVELSLLGSFNAEAMDVSLLLYVRAWEAAARARGHDVAASIDAPEGPTGTCLK